MPRKIRHVRENFHGTERRKPAEEPSHPLRRQTDFNQEFGRDQDCWHCGQIFRTAWSPGTILKWYRDNYSINIILCAGCRSDYLGGKITKSQIRIDILKRAKWIGVLLMLIVPAIALIILHSGG